MGLTWLRAANAALGLFLNVAVAAVFGVNRGVDALFVAMSVTVILARDLALVVRTAGVPCLVEHDERGGDPDFPGSFHGAALVFAAGSAAAVWIAAPYVVGIVSPGFEAAAAAEAAHLLRLLAPSLLLFVLFGSAQGVFHARRRFFVPEVSQMAWRLTAIASLLLAGRRWGIDAYACGLLIAAFLQWFLLFAVGARSGLRVLPVQWRPIRLKLLRPFLVGAAVVFCTVAQRQIEGTLDRAALSFMAPGAIAIFAYAERLAHMAPMLLSTSLLIPWLPEIARIRARVGDPRRLAKQGSLFLAALGALLAAVIFWAARDAVAIVLLRGRFDAASGETVVLALRAFALGIPAIFCVQCLAGLYIVERNWRAILGMGAVAVLSHGAGNLVLRRWGVAGIALSGSLTAWVVAIHLWCRIRTSEKVWFVWLRFAGAMAAASLLLYAIPWRTLPGWAPVRVTAGALTAWAVYTAVMWPAIRRMQAYEQQATRAAD